MMNEMDVNLDGTPISCIGMRQFGWGKLLDGASPADHGGLPSASGAIKPDDVGMKALCI
jgi:hypothetical protein